MRRALARIADKYRDVSMAYSALRLHLETKQREGF
jgi:hypothetical protein